MTTYTKLLKRNHFINLLEEVSGNTKNTGSSSDLSAVSSVGRGSRVAATDARRSRARGGGRARSGVASRGRARGRSARSSGVAVRRRLSKSKGGERENNERLHLEDPTDVGGQLYLYFFDQF